MVRGKLILMVMEEKLNLLTIITIASVKMAGQPEQWKSSYDDR